MIMNPLLNRLLRRCYRWLPYGIASGGIIASVFLWHSLLYEEPQIYFMSSLQAELPWIVLILGASLAILSAISLRLAEIMRQRSKSLDLVNRDIQKQIIERIEAEEVKQKLERALLQGQKLQAIGTLAGGIAHDFNNLLYAIIGYVEMAREDVEETSLVYKNLGKVLEASHRGQELISRILMFSRRQHHDFKVIPLQKTIENVLSLLRPTIPAGVTIQFEPMETEATILGDQTQLHQVIVNLINNAVDAMDGEGNVILSISRLHATDPYLQQFPDVINGNYCRIDMTDTGHGMDQSTIARIFEPFYTTKEVGKGTGLGLSTVHAIIKEHRGEIMVNSQLGQGTTFSLLLPEYN